MSASVQADLPVPINSLVRIRRGTQTLEGTIRKAAFCEIGYFRCRIQCRLGMVDQEFSPKHRVNLRNLRGRTAQRPVERACFQAARFGRNLLGKQRIA